MGSHLSTRGILTVIASNLQSKINASGDTFVLKKTDYEEIMFLEITSSMRRIREFWTLMRMTPGFTQVNQNAYAVDVEEFSEFLGLDFSKPIVAQLV